MTIFCLYIFDRYAFPYAHSPLHLLPSHKKTRIGIAIASTTTTGNTAPSVQNAPTKAAPSSLASRTLSPLPSSLVAPRPCPRPSPARATPSPRLRASSSRSATPASRPRPRVRVRVRVRVHHHQPLPRVALRRERERACLLMRKPSSCMASSSRCGIWSSVYLAGACTSFLPFFLSFFL
jgi:hypothetical protein